MKPLKLGLDVHGVIDTFPKDFTRLTKALVEAGHEVHVITGLKKNGKIEKELKDAGIYYTHYFSIVDQLEADGVEIKWVNGLPWAPDKPWNEAKAKYCETVHVDIHIDDSYVYRDSFYNISTVFLHLVNKDRRVFKSLDEKMAEAQMVKTVSNVENLLDNRPGANVIDIGTGTLRDLLGIIREQQDFIDQVKSNSENGYQGYN